MIIDTTQTRIEQQIGVEIERNNLKELYEKYIHSKFDEEFKALAEEFYLGRVGFCRLSC